MFVSIQSDCKISRFANVYTIPKISNRPLCADVYILRIKQTLASLWAGMQKRKRENYVYGILVQVMVQSVVVIPIL